MLGKNSASVTCLTLDRTVYYLVIVKGTIPAIKVSAVEHGPISSKFALGTQDTIRLPRFDFPNINIAPPNFSTVGL